MSLVKATIEPGSDYLSELKIRFDGLLDEINKKMENLRYVADGLMEKEKIELYYSFRSEP